MYSDYYDYGYSSYNSGVDSLLAGILTFYIFVCIFALAISVVQVIAMWKMFKKAGKNGWEAIIPFYNMWTLFEVSGYPGYYIFFAFIPCVGSIVLLVFNILAMISLAKKFNKSSGFAVLLILVPIVGFCILGFGNDVYDPSLGEQNNTEPIEAKVEEKPAKKTTTAKGNFCGNCGAKVTSGSKFCGNCGKEI